MTIKNLLCWWIAGLLIVMAGCGEKTPPPRKEVPLIPMQDFFRNPEKTGFKISPNGEYLSFLMPWQHRLNIYVQKIGQDQAIRITGATQRDITDYLWANDQRLLYLMDKNGDENYRAYGVNRDGSGYKELTPFENVRVGILEEREDIKDEILIGMNRRNPKIFDAYRLNIYTGELKMVGENPGNVSGWLADNAGQLRVAVATDGLNDTLLYRKTEADPFRAVVTTNFKDTLAPLFFTFDNQYLYVSSNLGRDKQAIYRYDLEKGQLSDLIYAHPEVDVEVLLRSKARRVITGVAFFTDKRHYYFFDKARRQMQDILQEQLPGYEVVAGDGGRNLRSKDETRVIVRTYSDKSLGAYYLYNQLTHELKKLAEVSPWIKESELADMQPIQYQSRDGLTLHGYLTLPRGVEPKNLPVVVNPHGGPWARDHWGFNPEVQFLANRGMAVLQMNFRGSTGYGKAFWQAGFKAVGPQDAGRHHRRGAMVDPTGPRRSQTGRNLRRLLRGLRHPGRRDLHPGSLCLRGGLRGSLQSLHPARLLPTLLGPGTPEVLRDGGRPGERQRVVDGGLPTVSCRPDQGTVVRGPGSP